MRYVCSAFVQHAWWPMLLAGKCAALVYPAYLCKPPPQFNKGLLASAQQRAHRLHCSSCLSRRVSCSTRRPHAYAKQANARAFRPRSRWVAGSYPPCSCSMRGLAHSVNKTLLVCHCTIPQAADTVASVADASAKGTRAMTAVAMSSTTRKSCRILGWQRSSKSSFAMRQPFCFI